MTTTESAAQLRTGVTVKRIIAENHHVPAPGILDLVQLGAAVEEARRFRLKVRDVRELTRTTALWAAVHLDDGIAKTCQMFGLRASDLAEAMSLQDTPEPAPVDDVAVNEELARALQAYLRSVGTPPRTIGLVDVAVAVLRDAAANGGLMATRLRDAHVDVASAAEALEGIRAADGPPGTPREADPAALSDAANLYLGFNEALRRRGVPTGDGEDRWTWPAFGLVVARRRGTLATLVVRVVLERAGERPSVIDRAAALRAFDLPDDVEPVWSHAPTDDDLLRAATAARDTVEPGEEIHLRHLVAAAIAGGTGPRGPATRDEDIAALTASFLSQIEHDAPAEVAARWRAHLAALPEPAPTPRASAAGRAMAGLQVDLVDNATEFSDELLVIEDVVTLCDVLAARGAPPPISVGLFGRWGSGKSYFMALMRRHIDEIRETARAAEARGQDTAYCTEIVQVTFNAWHYMDADDLWAPIAVHLFGAIAQVDPDDNRVRPRADVVRDLAQREQEMESVDRRITSVLSDPKLDHAANLMGLESARTDVLGVIHQVGTSAGFLPALRVLLTTGTWTRRRRRAVAGTGMIGLALVTVAILMLAGVLPAATLFACLPAAAAVLGTTTSWLRGIKAGLAQVNDLATASGLSEQDVTEERIAKDDEILRLRAELEAIDRLEGMGDFVRQRALSTDYTSRFGVLSVLRGDLEELVAKQRRESLDRRIILYIDDLDRCSPARVVEVLQAVHLLLAFPLFVAVVGVDPRWLLTSLQRHYRQVLAVPGGSPGTLGIASTPHDYLEKIFQIPFSLRPMAADGFSRLVNDLAGPVAAPPPATVGPNPDSPQPAATARPTGTGPPAAGADDPGGVALAPATDAPAQSASPERASPEPAIRKPDSTDALPLAGITPNPPQLQITSQEVAALARMGPLIGTPRAAKRLVNLYRLIRAGLPDCDIERFVAEEQYRPLLIVLSAQIGFSRIAAAVLGVLIAETGASLVESLDRTVPNTSVEADEVALRSALRAVCVDERGQPVAYLDRPVAELKAWIPRLRRFSLDGALSA